MKVFSYPYDRKNFQLAIVEATKDGNPRIFERIDSEPFVIMPVSTYNAKVSEKDQIELSDKQPVPITKIWQMVESMEDELKIRVVHRDEQ